MPALGDGRVEWMKAKTLLALEIPEEDWDADLRRDLSEFQAGLSACLDRLREFIFKVDANRTGTVASSSALPA